MSYLPRLERRWNRIGFIENFLECRSDWWRRGGEVSSRRSVGILHQRRLRRTVRWISRQRNLIERVRIFAASFARRRLIGSMETDQ